MRRETLQRPRLLDWLHAHIGTRVVLVTADAGFGKTTLLADFSARARGRTIWYRVDQADRDWATVLSHLVAAGQEHDPSFGRRTGELLADATNALDPDAALESFIEDLDELAVEATAIIFDDWHVADDASDLRRIANALVSRAPNGISLVFSGRRPPSIALGRLRAAGEVAELTTADLRFDLAETAQLFRETYGRSLDADIVSTLADRTEGWIASLQLVQAALRDRTRSEVRRFVGNLSGADHELYDYLAEVVVGELSDPMQHFLMTTSILQVVTPEMARLVSGVTDDEARQLMAQAERLALLAGVSGGPRTHLRYHPLVREFLESRLAAIDGVSAVRALHLKVACDTPDWRVAAHHYREAGDHAAVLATVDRALPTIMANAQYGLAQSYLTDTPDDQGPSRRHLVLGRLNLQLGDYEAAAVNARSVLNASPMDAVQRDHALLNLLAVHFNYGHGEQALEVARELRGVTSDDNLRAIAEATIAILGVATEHDLEGVNHKLRSMARTQRSGQAHHFAISMYNLAANSLMQDRLVDAEIEVREALAAFTGTSSVVERQAAEVLLIGIQLRNGQGVEAASEIRHLLGAGALQDDAALEAADAFDAFGSRELADALLDKVADQSAQTLAEQRIAAIARARILLRRGQPDDAARALATYPDGVSTMVGMSVWRLVLEGQIALALGRDDSLELLTVAIAEATRAGIHSARRVAELLKASTESDDQFGQTVRLIAEVSPWHISSIAEVIVPHLPRLEAELLELMARIASLHPDRWRVELRRCLAEPACASVEAAELLEAIGERRDIALLRSRSKDLKGQKRASNLGRALARRLAHNVYVEDLGRVVIRAGDRVVLGSKIRRKVLALLCFLLTRSDSAATRDQVLDALWPDLDPGVAANSLNQTLYFLRRVLEENYEEDHSPGYVHFEGDVIWLDQDLVTSRSTVCRQMISGFPPRPSPDDVLRLAAEYRGRFALDFEYEEWALGYRESLHAAFLEIVERALREDAATGHHDRAIRVARRALEADPSSDQIEVSLLRLYKSTGAHAAAAEQYVHYASVLRDDLGLEPPPLDSL